MRKSRSKILFFLTAVLLAITFTATGVSARQTSKTPKTPASKPAPASAAKPASTAAKIDLNTGSEKDLESLPGVGAATAKKIIAGRPYSSVNDLSKAGVSASTIKKITPLVTASGAAPAAAAAPAPAKSTAPAAASKPAPAPAPAPTASKPAAAAPAPAAAPAATQAAAGPGTVWVNLDSGVYHKQGTRYYGKTKNGKYMSEADAIKAGYRAAKKE